MKANKITVNGKPIDGTYIMRNSDKIEHHTIRRELPVYNLPLKRIYEDDEIVVIDKPPSIPVHPCGAYNKNSLVKILELEEGAEKLSRKNKIIKQFIDSIN